MTQPTILAETPNYYVINKSAGWAVEPIAHYLNILDWLIEQKKIKKSDWPADSRFGVVHRLDVETSGVLIWAKTPVAQERLKLLWQGRGVEKTYIGLAVGELAPRQGTVDVPIMRDNQKDKQTIVLLPNLKARPAITTYKTLAVSEIGQQKISLFEAHPITGRTHQIRVHLKYLGHPIIGDKLYGDKAAGEMAKKLDLHHHFLHAWKICLPNGKRLDFYQASLPEDLKNVVAQYFPKTLI